MDRLRCDVRHVPGVVHEELDVFGCCKTIDQTEHVSLVASLVAPHHVGVKTYPHRGHRCLVNRAVL